MTLRHTLAPRFKADRLESVEKIAQSSSGYYILSVGAYVFVFRICFKNVAGDILVDGRAFAKVEL